ncbi:hypothetical protein WJX84_009778 [Apatococcus fuscideae]|uniref:Major facilitator superfamily (MFS) profile domain-containing protein n=1 Tax=Apatococcus fuscideae TaxID=2026836 RepID=A0AAW1T6V4_9CHLO
MLMGLAIWSVISGLTPLVRHVDNPLLWLTVARVALGLAQSCAAPAASAASAQWVPAEKRGRAMSILYGCFNAGSVLSMALTPIFATELGWPSAFRSFAIVGLIWAAVGWKIVPARDYSKKAPAGAVSQEQSPNSNSKAAELSQELQAAGKASTSSVDAVSSHILGAAQGAYSSNAKPRKQEEVIERNWPQILLLCWTHGVIGWGFFIFGTWIPTYLDYLGVTNLKTAGFLSALPWAATATAAVLAGLLADKLQTGLGWSTVRVRRVMQSAATLGPALALVPVALGKDQVSVPLAVACLTGTLALQAFCYAGFHAYLQDVASADAGKLLGLTNSASTSVGIIGNLITGQLAGMHHGYSIMFAITAMLYFGSFCTWNLFMKGAPVRL